MLIENGTAVITGAASGFGLEMAKLGKLANMNLVLADIDYAQLLVVAEEHHFDSAKTVLLKTDVSQEADVEEMCRQAYTRFHTVELLVNNAGVAINRLTWQHSHQDWEWVMGVNVFSITHAIRHFVPKMLAQSSPAHIVNTASVAGFLSPPGGAAYNASKHAVVTISETLYRELHDVGAKIGVSVLCPAFVATKIGDSERNRPDTFGPYKEIDDETTKKYLEQLRYALKSGKLSAADIAQAAFEAVKNDQFYIIPHRKINLAIGQRMNEILNLQNPSFY
jgi:NADP-dependent 3-hydroxy acid dehydrogenase YdfG